MSTLDALRKAATAKTTGAKKSTTPVVSPSDVVVAAMKDFKRAKELEIEAKSKIADAEARMLPESAELLKNTCRSTGTLHASVRIQGDGVSLLFTQKNQSKIVPSDQEDSIRKVVGAEKYKDWFRPATQYTIDESALTPEIAQRLMDALGQDIGILTAKTVIEPTDQYYHDARFNDRDEVLAKKLEADGIVVPYKGSYKV